MRRTLIALALVATVTTAAHAADTVPFACMPQQLGGTGTRAAASVNGTCAWAGWYCPGVRMPQLMVIRKDSVTSTHQVLIAAALNGDLKLADLNDIRSRVATANVWSGPLFDCWWPERDKLLAVRPQPAASAASAASAAQ